MKTVNNLIFCSSPEAPAGVTAEVKNGFASFSQKKNTVSLTVQLDSSSDLGLKAGDKILVKEEDTMVQPWAKSKILINGVEGILVPQQFIVAVNLA